MKLRHATLVCLLAVALAAPASALDFQQREFYGQAVVALPMGDFGDISNFGAGAGLGMRVPHNENFSFRGEASYLYFSDDIEGNDDVSLYQIPVLVLAQYDVKESPAYILGGLGLAFTHFDLGLGEIEGVDTASTETDLALAFGAGARLSPHLTLEGRFNLVSDANSVSAHIGWYF